MTDSNTVTFPNDAERGAFTIAAFCLWADVPRTRVYDEINNGRLKTRKLGRRTMIRRADAEAWLDSLPTAAAA